MKVEEAKNKFCPNTYAERIIAGSSSGPIKNFSFGLCIADECMAWVWDEIDQYGNKIGGHCGRYSK